MVSARRWFQTSSNQRLASAVLPPSMIRLRLFPSAPLSDFAPASRAGQRRGYTRRTRRGRESIAVNVFHMDDRRRN
jgi:hypothetical protein